MAAVRVVEKDLDVEDEVGEADAVVGEGGVESRPRTGSTFVLISPSPIIIRISTSGSMLQRSKRFGITKENSLDLLARIRMIPIQLRN